MVEILHQDSETASKPTYLRGHHWGCIGLLTYLGSKFWCTPLWAEIHRDALEEKRSTRIISQAIAIATSMPKNADLVLDAFFSVGPVFSLLSDDATAAVIVLTRAEKNVTAFRPAV